jgi:hypothetical protein
LRNALARLQKAVCPSLFQRLSSEVVSGEAALVPQDYPDS